MKQISGHRIYDVNSYFVDSTYSAFFTIREDIKLHSKAYTVHIWLIDPCKFSGISFLMRWNFLTRCIALSTWILTDAIVWLSFTSALVNCCLPSKNAGQTHQFFQAPHELKILDLSWHCHLHLINRHSDFHSSQQFFYLKLSLDITGSQLLLPLKLQTANWCEIK